MNATVPTGLTRSVAERRLAEEGANELPQPLGRNALHVVTEVLKEPMLLLLLAACAVYLALGDLAEAVLISVLATASVAITVIQEIRTERVLAALRDLTAPRALVIRQGQRLRIPARELVRDDILVLSEGDRIPADGVLVSAQNLKADESLLTGEAVPVPKVAQGAAAADIAEGTEAGHPYRQQDWLFSGTLVVAGSGYARVTATGPRSEIGKIGKSLGDIVPEAPRLQQQIRTFVRVFAVVGVSLCVVAALLYGFSQGDWLRGILGGLALSLSLLPEEFPVILVVFLAMGAWRIARVGVLTRKAAAIESLGSATVLCTDKTGTLTENRMTVAELRTSQQTWCADEGRIPPSSAIADVLRFSVLASQRNPYDPMERALHDLGRNTMEGEPRGTLLRRYGISPELPAMSQLWDFANATGPATGNGEETDAGGSYVVAAKGAPEAIAALCKLDEPAWQSVRAAADDMAARGMRVLAVANATATDGAGPASQHDFAFAYVGLVGLHDPLKQSVPPAVRECYSAGIRVVMITGDYPLTASAIAREAGIFSAGVLTGDDIDALGDAALADRVRTVSIFARVRPQQKLRIVNALKANGEIVAMTGDGVNDAPSLKAAHIGVAMGGRGTDVAREAASIVLLDDDFKSIVTTIRLGRRIYDNLRKAMTFVAAIHIPVAGLAFLPVLFGLPLILLPVHIAFLEMIIDPVSSVAFEAEADERDIMSRPPRDPRATLISRAFLMQAGLQGTAALATVAAIFLMAAHNAASEAETRGLVFLTLVLSNMVLVVVNRAFNASPWEMLTRPNTTLWIVAAADGAILAALFLVPALREVFRFAVPDITGTVAVLAAVALLFVGLTAVKHLFPGGNADASGSGHADV